jgi:hypothetical protein
VEGGQADRDELEVRSLNRHTNTPVAAVVVTPARVDHQAPVHSLKNRTGSLVEPEKTGTGDHAGLLSALNHLRYRIGKNQLNRSVLLKTSEPPGLV